MQLHLIWDGISIEMNRFYQRILGGYLGSVVSAVI